MKYIPKIILRKLDHSDAPGVALGALYYHAGYLEDWGILSFEIQVWKKIYLIELHIK